MKLQPGETVNILAVDVPVITPPDTSGATPLPWVEYGNSRTVVTNCNPAGDFRKFTFTIPTDAHSGHAIRGSEYANGIGNFRSVVLKDAQDGAVIDRQRGTTIGYNFSFVTKLGYTVVVKGKTYILEITSDPTPGYVCSYYIDLNNSN